MTTFYIVLAVLFVAGAIYLNLRYHIKTLLLSVETSVHDKVERESDRLYLDVVSRLSKFEQDTKEDFEKVKAKVDFEKVKALLTKI